MTASDPRADAPPLNWSDLGVSELLPTGTVTLLLADVEGSTRLWQTRPDEMAAAVAVLDKTLCNVVAAHAGVRPVEQGEGDSFVVAFARAGDAAACALALQQAPLAPIRLRIGVHTGDVQMRDEGNYMGPTIIRAARLRDLAHGGQTVLSGTTCDLVADDLPQPVWLADLGTHSLRDLPRPERVFQLCHPDTHNDFPPLRTSEDAAVQHLPMQLTSFVGRAAQIADVRRLLTDERLVTLTGAGGAGKTRLALQVASNDEFGEGARYVDLAPISEPEVLPVAVVRALGLPDQPGRSTVDTITHSIGSRPMLLVLDNCEHLLDATAELVMTILAACSRVTLLATSREPVGVDGEVTYRVPSLSLADEALDLFIDRARRVRPEFTLGGDETAAVMEICKRLDGMPLAIELAAARVRALSLPDILDSLHDRFRLLTGGARKAVRRQQTLHASVDWSHALLTEPERILFRRLAAFVGGFDLDGAQAVCASGDVERYHVMDQLTLLVDKSLVVAETANGRTRYRLLETVRQYASEKLGESGEADKVRSRHRDHYTAMAAALDAPAAGGHERRVEQAEDEIDNLRAAFAWSRENDNSAKALELACSLQPMWLTRGRIQEGMTWLDAALEDSGDGDAEVLPERVRALSDRAFLGSWTGAVTSVEQIDEALAVARELGDTGLLIRVLEARGYLTHFDADGSRPYFEEAASLAREHGDSWRLCQVLQRQANSAMIVGDLAGIEAAAREGRAIADAIGDRFTSRHCQFNEAVALMYRGDLARSAEQFQSIIEGATAARDLMSRVIGLFTSAYCLASLGDTDGALAASAAALQGASDLGPWYETICYPSMVFGHLAAGDASAAWTAAGTSLGVAFEPITSGITVMWVAQAAVANGDLDAARRYADIGVSDTHGSWLTLALTIRARVAMAVGDMETAQADLHEALPIATTTGTPLCVPDVLELLAALACEAGSHQEAARLFGAADSLRQRMGSVRFRIYDPGHDAAVAVARDALGENEFAAAWAEGAGLSTEEAVSYAQRGRGERKRPATGWAALTPAELDVVALVGEGLTNKDIATRLFISPRTVNAHLSHVYSKLGLSSRVQLGQAAAEHKAQT